MLRKVKQRRGARAAFALHGAGMVLDSCVGISFEERQSTGKPYYECVGEHRADNGPEVSLVMDSRDR